jgi:UrcA family protein
MKRTILAAAVALVALPVAAQAAEYRVLVRGDVEQRSVEVYMGDLNLTNPRDAREASRRIDGAARYVCQPSDARELSDRADYRQCRYEAYDTAWADLEDQAGGPVGQGRVYTRDVPPYSD